MNQPSKLDRVLIVVFIGLLWLPALDSLWGLDHCRPPIENRKLASFPAYKGMGEYAAGLEHYFDDHFGFRNQLVRWNNDWKLNLFHDSPFTSALPGQDGWLYWAGDAMLAHYEGSIRFTPQDLDDWQKLLEARRDWLAARGEKYVFVIAPDKQSIYPEYLPNWVRKSVRPSKLDDFLAHMRSSSTVEVVDLRASLIAAKMAGPVYLQTDTHWNNFGAFIGYQQLLQAVQRQMPQLKPLPLDAFDRVSRTSRGGDLAVCLEQQDVMQETNDVSFTPRLPLAPLTELDAASVQQRTGTQGIITRNPQATGKAVLFRDSFAEAWVPFLGHHFQEVIYLRQPEWNKPLLEREKPDLVVDEMVERLFNNQNPRQLRVLDH